jgi:predicted esterase
VKVRYKVLILIASGMSVLHARCAELVQVSWPTQHAAPVAKLEPTLQQWLPAFQLALDRAPESAIVSLALSQPTLLGLNLDQAKTLQPLVKLAYEKMAQSEIYGKANSALPYNFSSVRPTLGLASVYLPTTAGAKSPVLVFLHGYGGSFLWYQHYLSEIFPDHIIICPVFGISPATIPQQYVSEAMTAIAKTVGFSLSRPTLIGLSAGGFGACRLYVRDPSRYQRLICLAAYPPDETLVRFPSNASACFLSGALEPFVTSLDFHKRIQRIQRLCPNVVEMSIPEGGHFFLLTHREQTTRILQRWVADGTKISP